MTYDEIVNLVADSPSHDYPLLFRVDGQQIAYRITSLVVEDDCLCVVDPANAHIEENAERDVDGTIHRWGTCMDCDGDGITSVEQISVKAVGDDREFAVFPDQLTLIEGDVCSCGELGCEWH